MPDAKYVVINVGVTSNAFLSPFSDRPPVAFYSSISIPRASNSEGCIPCGITGIKRKELAQFIQEISTSTEHITFASGTYTKDTVPDIPSLPNP